MNNNNSKNPQQEAVRRVLMEISQLLVPYKDSIRLIGGWVPELTFPQKGHVGSFDVDVLVNQETIDVDCYEHIPRQLERLGYSKHPDSSQFFSYIKKVTIGKIDYEVTVDFLAGSLGVGTSAWSQHLPGKMKALKLNTGDYAFKHPPIKLKLKGSRVDGALDAVEINLVSSVPFFVLKTDALHRNKPKDSYDMYFYLNNFDDFNDFLNHFTPYKKDLAVQIMARTLKDKFETIDHSGPIDIVNFMGIIDPLEFDQIRREAQVKFTMLANYILDDE